MYQKAVLYAESSVGEQQQHQLWSQIPVERAVRQTDGRN